jgi:hypothetical protein
MGGGNITIEDAYWLVRFRPSSLQRHKVPVIKGKGFKWEHKSRVWHGGVEEDVDVMRALFKVESAGGYREYGSWMTAGRTSGISDSEVASGNTITNPIGVIESVIEDELNTRWGLSLNVHTTSFDDAYDDRDSDDWKFGFSLIEQYKSKTLLEELALNCACKIFKNYENKYAIKAYDKTSPSIDYHFYGEPDHESESANYGKIIENELSIETTPKDEVYSAFKVYYNYDYWRSKYTDFVYVDSTDSNWDTVTDTTAISNCSDAEDYIAYKEFIFEARFIQDKETAERLCEYFNSRLYKVFHIAKFKCGAEGILLEPWDIIDANHYIVDELFSLGAPGTKKWMVTKVSTNGLQYTVEAIEY